MNLDQAQLERRNKELDAKEAFIDAKAKLLEDAPISIKVYESRVKAYENQIDSQLQEIKKHEQLLETLKVKHHDLNKKHDRSKNTLDNSLLKLKSDIAEKEKTYNELKLELKNIKESITERTKYLKEQEELVNNVIEEGNDKLMELKLDIIDTEEELKKIQMKKVDLRTQYEDMVIDFEQAKEVYDDEITQLQQQNARLVEEVKREKKLVNTISNEYKVIQAEIDSKLDHLKEKETSIIVKRDALRLEKQELETEKRRWESTKGLYDD